MIFIPLIIPIIFVENFFNAIGIEEEIAELAG